MNCGIEKESFFSVANPVAFVSHSWEEKKLLSDYP
jgi:hypothetical protein